MIHEGYLRALEADGRINLAALGLRPAPRRETFTSGELAPSPQASDQADAPRYEPRRSQRSELVIGGRGRGDDRASSTSAARVLTLGLAVLVGMALHRFSRGAPRFNPRA